MFLATMISLRGNRVGDAQLATDGLPGFESFVHNIQNIYGGHTASYPMGIMGFLLAEWDVKSATHLHNSVALVRE
jgi:hypothetical protein